GVLQASPRPRKGSPHRAPSQRPLAPHSQPRRRNERSAEVDGAMRRALGFQVRFARRTAEDRSTKGKTPVKSDLKIDGNRIQITRVFDAPRERVFAAWKLPELMQRWSGCKETAKVEFTVDFRVGGSFTQKMDIEGAGKHTITGVYDEIIEPE